MKWDSALYDTSHAFVSGYGSALVDLLDPKPGERIADLGCGTGDLSAEMAERGAEVRGLDASEGMIRAARQKYPHLRFDCVNVYDWNSVSEFDAVFSNAALHWMLRPDEVLNHVFQALKPGGRLVLEMGMKGNIARILEAIEVEWRSRLSPLPLPVQPWYFPGCAEYAGKLESAGFELVWMRAFERPTELDDPERGMIHWLDMFAGMYLEGLNDRQAELLKQAVQERLRPQLFRDGRWFADYRRLRLEARRPVE